MPPMCIKEKNITFLVEVKDTKGPELEVHDLTIHDQ